MNSPRRILIVTDDPLLRQMLDEHLTAAGHAVATADAGGALAMADSHDVAVIDGAADADGNLTRELKAKAALAVIALGGAGTGANACLPKPVRLGALMAQLTQLTSRPDLMIGRWRFDQPGRVLVAADGTRLRLTDKEAAILTLLAKDGGVVGRDRLLAEIWSYSATATTHTLETHVYRLRRKIEADPATARLLVTEPGGYRLSGVRYT